MQINSAAHHHRTGLDIVFGLSLGSRWGKEEEWVNQKIEWMNLFVSGISRDNRKLEDDEGQYSKLQIGIHFLFHWGTSYSWALAGLSLLIFTQSVADFGVFFC